MSSLTIDKILEDMAWEIIHYAALGKKGKVEGLLKEGTEIDAMNLNQETALFHAAKHGRRSVVKYLLHYGANPNRLVIILAFFKRKLFSKTLFYIITEVL